MQTLLDIEEIKQLKARYFRGIDTCNLELLKTVLADDEFGYAVGRGHFDDLLNSNVIDGNNLINKEVFFCKILPNDFNFGFLYVF